MNNNTLTLNDNKNQESNFDFKQIIKSQNDKINKLIDIVNNNTLALNDHKNQRFLITCNNHRKGLRHTER